MKRFFLDNSNEEELKQKAGISEDGVFWKDEGDKDESIRVKALYDLADIIKDKRYDKTFAGLNTRSGKSRIADLEKLLMAALKYRKHEDLELLILTDITVGNICLNLSPCYLSVFEYEKAKEYAQKGREHLWEALQEIENLEEHEPYLYLLIRLNMAKYCWEWAALTRRSNYDPAQNELDNVLKGIGDFKERQGEDAEDVKRKAALLYVDAKFNRGRILRLDYRLDDAKEKLKEMLAFLRLYNTKVAEEKENQEKLKGIEYGDFQAGKEEKEFEWILDFLTDEDWKDYYVSALIQLSLALIQQRNYEEAKNLSQKICDYDITNRDARNNLGICLRKQRKLEEAIQQFLAVVKLKSGDNKIDLEENQLAKFLTSEVKRIKKENVDNLESGQKENKEIDNRFAYINVLKCVLELTETGNLDKSVFDDAYFIMENHLKHDSSDYEVQMLKCRYLMQKKKTEQAIELLKEMIQSKELSYIRRGAIGLKVRYMLAKCYIWKYQFHDAEKLLLYVRRELHKDGTELLENRFDAMVENNIGWCLLQEGRFREALECYKSLVENLYNVCTIKSIKEDNKNIKEDNKNKKEDNKNKKEDNKNKKEDNKNKNVIEMLKKILGEEMEQFFDKDVEIDKLLKNIQFPKESVEDRMRSNHMKIRYLNNLGECYLKVEGEAEEGESNVEMAKRIFNLVLNISPDDGIAFLYRGCCETEKEERAKWFKMAFRLRPEEIEVRSSYFINLVQMCLETDMADEKYGDYKRAIEEFVDYNPHSYSLNMCLALIRWKFGDLGIDKNGCIENDIEKLCEKDESFLKKFSRISLYPELGTEAFNRLKNKSGFCYLKSMERGLVMIYLLRLYEPIIKIRKKCHFQYDDWKALVGQMPVEGEEHGSGEGERNKGRHRSGLVHYTTLQTLKALLNPNGRPYLRISNSGYMNDSAEGEIFFEEMRYAVKDLQENSGENVTGKNQTDFNDIAIDRLIQEYFRELQGNSDEVLPRGGNVFITSLSTQADSFPMWDIYAGKQQGCNIEFDEGFYNLKGSSWGILDDKQEGREGKGLEDGPLEYGISAYTDADYPLYEIQYIYRDHYKEAQNPRGNLPRICKRNTYNSDEIEKMKHEELEGLLQKIAVRWNTLDKLLKVRLERKEQDEIVMNAMKEAKSEIRAFVADRINEVRYLFKDRDYSFEGEVRLVKVVDVDETRRHTDDREIPRAFTEMDKEITDITVTLASKISDEQVNEITTWLKHTGKVKNVKIAMRNRLRRPLV